jgi:hypothetical protein
MKLRIYLLGLFFCIVTPGAYTQQASDSEPWPTGVRLSITLTNNIIARNSEIALRCRVTNGSTNTLILPVTSGQKSFEVRLLNALGETRQLTPGADSGPFISRTIEMVQSGQARDYEIMVRVDEGVIAGVHQLQAKRKVLVGHTEYELMSEPLKVRVR